MKVIWTPFALNSLKNIFTYYKTHAGISVAKAIKNNILTTTIQLSKYPTSGQKEELLKELDEAHRYLIRGNYKIIYKILNDTVYITDVFDTRQNPDKLKR